MPTGLLGNPVLSPTDCGRGTPAFAGFLLLLFFTLNLNLNPNLPASELKSKIRIMRKSKDCLAGPGTASRIYLVPDVLRIAQIGHAILGHRHETQDSGHETTQIPRQGFP